MPIYEYRCRDHGTFEALRSIQERAVPERCPECKARAPRVLSPPQLRRMAKNTRVALERNEQSRHEPRLSSTPEAVREGEPVRAPPRPHRHVGRPWAIEHG